MRKMTKLSSANETLSHPFSPQALSCNFLPHFQFHELSMMNSQHLQTCPGVHALPPPPVHSRRVLLRAQGLRYRKLSENTTCITSTKTTFLPQLCRRGFDFGGYGSRRGVIRSSVARETNEVAEQKQKQKQQQQMGVRRAYPFHEIEPKWQRYWEDDSTFRTPDEIDTSKPKYYVLDMFPYPRSLYLAENECFVCFGSE